MKRLNVLSQIILHFFKNRSVLFYIFWLSFFIGEGFYRILLKVNGCSALMNENKLIGWHGFHNYQISACGPIEKAFVEVCILIFIFTIIAYFTWCVFILIKYLFAKVIR